MTSRMFSINAFAKRFLASASAAGLSGNASSHSPYGGWPMNGNQLVPLPLRVLTRPWTVDVGPPTAPFIPSAVK